MMQFRYTLWPWRFINTLMGLYRGVRISPSAVCMGPPSNMQLGAGTAVGSRTRLILGQSGQMITGPRVWLSADIEIETATEVRIGARTTIQRRCTINGSTRIGADCILAPDVFISSGTHPFRHEPHLPIREQERRVIAARDPQGLLDRPVWIQDDCWLGVHAVVCPGVTIGKGSVVGANAVVTQNVPPYSIVAGIPARIISQRLPWTPPEKLDLRQEDALIYVICGIPARTSDAQLCGITPDDSSTLQVALQATATAARLKITFQATGMTRWSLGKEILNLDPALGQIEIPFESTAPSSGTWTAVHLKAMHAFKDDKQVIFTGFEILTLHANANEVPHG
jgi:acetyltransferase-like isoleucine patch superfamily enzyme